MRILQTDVKPEEQKDDLPELEKAHAIALETQFTWRYFGGIITLTNGNQYQVIE